MYVSSYRYFKTNVRIIRIMQIIYFTKITNHVSNHTTYFYNYLYFLKYLIRKKLSFYYPKRKLYHPFNNFDNRGYTVP